MKRTCQALAIALAVCAAPVVAHPASLTPRPVLGPVIAQGTASWYGRQFQGRMMTIGEPFNMFGLTCANRTLPLGTEIKVTNLANHRCVFLKVTDRGPFVGHRVLDVSYAASKALGFEAQGLTQVTIQVVHG